MTLGKLLRRGERGQTLVEIAITLPLLVLILLGAAELARLAYAAIEVTNAAKAAVQYGDQNFGFATDCCGPGTGMYTAANNDAANLASPVTLTSSSTYQCSNAPGVPITIIPGVTTSAICGTAQIEEILTVNTSASFNPLIHLPGLPATYTITGHASQIVLGS